MHLSTVVQLLLIYQILFISQHSLLQAIKNSPVSINTIHECPITLSLLIHNVIAKLKVLEYQEVLCLGIALMHYPILLGIDWLKQHIPSID